MTRKISGGCACGEIRYECARKPITMLLCHCRDCQRASGSAFVPVLIVPAMGFKITKGEPRWHLSERLLGGQNRRGFCGTCGSRLFGAGNERIQGITATSLDDPSWFKPTIHIFTSHAQPWEFLDPALPKLKEHLPNPTGAAIKEKHP